MHSRKLIRLVAVGLATSLIPAPTVPGHIPLAAHQEERLLPPPRRVDDINALLDHQWRDGPDIARSAPAASAEAEPKTDDPGARALFYFRRAQTAINLGRARQAVTDLAEAARLAELHGPGSDLELRVLNLLAGEQFLSGNHWHAIATLHKAISRVPGDRRGWLIIFYSQLARVHAAWADLESAERAMRQAQALHDASRTWERLVPVERARFDAYVATGRASILESQGRFAEAAEFYGQAVSAVSSHEALSKASVDILTARRATALAAAGRLLEAEVEARRAVLGALRNHGRDSPRTASVVRYLAWVLFDQGRYAEAEALTRTALDMFENAGASPQSSITVTESRRRLVAALVAQGRWGDALAEYDAFRRALNDDALFRSLTSTPDIILTLLRAGRLDTAAALLRHRLDNRARRQAPPVDAEFRALGAILLDARGHRATAAHEFAAAVPLLLQGASETSDELMTRAHRDQRRAWILDWYIGLLADITGTALELEVGLDAAGEAFKLADVARGRPLRRVLDEGAARNAARTPALANLVREEQDARRNLESRYRRLNALLGQPGGRHEVDLVRALDDEVAALRRKRQALAAEIAQGFPAYAELVRPVPPTLAEARSALRPGEALISIYTTRDRTLVWAIPHVGEIAFATAPLGEQALVDLVRRMRRALDPGITSAGEIPEFDLHAAHEIYAGILDPVKSGWAAARDLLVVAHGPVAQIPFSVLPVRLMVLPESAGVRFSGYRAVPWLVRTHAVTVVPSVSSLVTLRRLPAAGPDRRPFVGFGDPLFSRAQAEAARLESAPRVPTSAGTPPIALRRSPRTFSLSSATLAMLPRLPETAEEIQGVARAMQADLTRDVFLRERASEPAVRTTNLSRYRVVAFATHGLVPGEINGLLEPALALTAPEVAGGDGDGLLTVDKILGLRLDADWVVLSACNTAGSGAAGAEAVSGLGRAFFYAGAKALLVSNWPVETTSAATLIIELFRIQRDERVMRAQALREAMLAMIDGPGSVDPATRETLFSYAHPLFWAPFTIVGDGGHVAAH